MPHPSHSLEEKEILEMFKVYIQSIAKREGYVHYNYEIIDFINGGGNFMSEIIGIDIKGATEKGEKETNLFIKRKIPLNKGLVCETEFFRLEKFMYTELSDIFLRLEIEANVPDDDRFKLVKAYEESNDDAIILDNMSLKGFMTYDCLRVVPLKFIRLTIQQLAKLHGLSFIVENKMPDFFNNRIRVLEHPLHYNEDWNLFMRNVCTYVANLCDEDTKTRVENFIPVFLEKIRKYDSDKTSTTCALTHGNCRAANVLVRERNGEPEEVIIVDYQFIDYGCPIRDFYFAILANTDREVRRNHMNELKDEYFDTLSRYLHYFDMDVEAVYPRAEFERVYVEWMDYGLMKMFLAMPFLFPPDTGIDLGKGKLKEIPFSLSKDIQNRVRELIQDFIDWGCL